MQLALHPKIDERGRGGPGSITGHRLRGGGIEAYRTVFSERRGSGGHTRCLAELREPPLRQQRSVETGQRCTTALSETTIGRPVSTAKVHRRSECPATSQPCSTTVETTRRRWTREDLNQGLGRLYGSPCRIRPLSCRWAYRTRVFQSSPSDLKDLGGRQLPSPSRSRGSPSG
jgi:hypothetical protein